MHRSLLALAALTTLSGLAACNEEDPAALFADVEYQVRCIDCVPLGPDGPKRDFSAVDGQDGVSLRCESAGGQISLEIVGSGYSFKVIDALPGDDPGNQCEVRVSEGSGMEYRGSCKPVGASSSRPCEVELTVSGSSFTGTVECHGIASPVNNTIVRHVVLPGTTDKPAELSVQGCAGL